ncbi:MAG: glycosyltransferase family 39 protein [Myxococcota bacterium]|nr:glycosyltransferase family 39 protein [Myxococcota bacterium]
MQNRSAQELTTALSLAVIYSVVQWPLFNRMVIPMDEGHLAATAQWMLDGQGLYADLHTGIFPGIYLMTAGLFTLFGSDLLVTRIAAAGINTVIGLSLWRIARRIVSPAWSLAPSAFHLALIAFAFPVLSMFNYSTTALCFALLALLFLLRYLETGRSVDGLSLGFLIAATALTKQNFGALTFMALALSFFWGRRGSALETRGLLRALGPIISAGLALTSVLVIWMATDGLLLAFIDRTIVTLGGSQLQDFNNPIPSLFGPHPKTARFTFLYTPPALFDALVHGQPFLGLNVGETLRSVVIRISYGAPLAVLVAGLAWLGGTFKRSPDPNQIATRSVILFASFFSFGIFPSAIWSHLAFVLPPISLVAILLADRLTRWLDARRGRVGLFAWRTGVALSGVFLLAILVARTQDVVRWNPEPLNLDRAHLMVSKRSASLLKGAVEYLNDCANPREAVVALPDIPVVWFLVDRPNASRFDLAIPGAVDGGEIVRGLRSKPVRCVVMNPHMYPEFPPFKVLYPDVAAHLEQQYGVARVLPGEDTHWVGLVRRGGPVSPQ